MDYRVGVDIGGSLLMCGRLLARLGGYLARSHDPPPDSMVMWRGMRRLNDWVLGVQMAEKNVGNYKIRQALTFIRRANMIVASIMLTQLVPAALGCPAPRSFSLPG